MCSTTGDIISTPGVFSTLGDIIEYTGGVQYNGGFMSTPGVFSTVGDTMSTLGEYHEHTRACSVHWGFHTNSIVLPMTFPTFVTISPRCTHDILPVY